MASELPATPDHPSTEAQLPTPSRNEERWRAIFDHADDAILILNNERRLVDANPAACEMIGATLPDIVGQDIDVFFRPLPVPGLTPVAEHWAKFRREGRDTRDYSVHRADGTLRYASFRARANFQPGLHLCHVRDVTEQRLAEESLRRAEWLYRSLIDTAATGYLITDAQGRVLEANAEYIHLTQLGTPDALRSRRPTDWIAPHDHERFDAETARCLEQGSLRDLEIDFIDPHGHTTPVEINTTAVATDDGVRLLTVCQDITARRRTQRELQNARRELEGRVERRTAALARANEQIRARARQQEAVAELGRLALAGTPTPVLMQRAVDSVVAMLDVEFCAMLEHADPADTQLYLRAAAGWSGDEVGKPVSTADPQGLAGYALRRLEPVIYEQLDAEKRFRPPARLLQAGIRSGITVQIPGDPQPFGLISAQSSRARKFTPDDASFLQSIGNVLAAAIERHRAEDTIRQAQQSAVQANNAKIEFLSRMSHELRTPLNAILGFSQLLEIEPLGPRQSESVEQITRAGRHLLELVNEVLDISRIDSGHIALVTEPLAVHDLLREALDLIRPLANRQNIRLLAGSGFEREDRFVLADHQKIRQVLLNLLSNAVKYNREGGSVDVSSAPTPDGRFFRLSVRDTGIGIKPEYLSRLYTPFERLGAENTDVEGSGMGLALSKRLVETQGGVLGVKSEPDVGTTFWVDLPVAAAPAPSLLEVIDDLPGTGFLLREEPSLPAASLRARESDACRTVLHIEDNEANRLLIEMLIAQRPAVRLLTAARGKEGLKLAREHHPDLILLDLHLPDTSGELVLHDLRADAGTKDTPVVMVSADATAVRRNQAYGQGANDFLTKPFNVEQFFKILDSYLEAAA